MRAATATLVVVAALTVSCAWSQVPSDASDAPAEAITAEEGASYVSMLDVLGKLAVAVIVAIGLVHGVRWWRERSPISGLGERRGRLLRLEESLSLGVDGRLHLVEVDGRRLLLAGREGNLQRLADLSDEPERASIYRSIKERRDGGKDELTVSHRPLSTRPVRPDVVRDDESWEQRRSRLLRELQGQ